MKRKKLGTSRGLQVTNLVQRTSENELWWIGVFGLLFIIPHLFRGLFFPREQLVAFLFIFGFALLVYLRYRPKFAMRSTEWALLILVLAYLLSVLTAASLRGAIQGLLKVAAFSATYLTAVTLTGASETRTAERRALWLSGAALLGTVMLALSAIFAAGGVLTYQDAVLGGRLASTLQYPNTLSAVVTAGFILAGGFQTRFQDRVKVSLLAATQYTLLLTLVFTYSRGGWLTFPVILALFVLGLRKEDRWIFVRRLVGPLVAVAATASPFEAALKQAPSQAAVLSYLAGLVLVVTVTIAVERLIGTRALNFIRNSRYRWASFTLPAALVLLVLIARPGVIPASLLQRAGGISLSQKSVWERVVWTMDAASIIKAHPLLGVGGDGWATVYRQYQSYPYFTTQVHNDIAQIGVESGLIGLGAFSAFLVLFTIQYWRWSRRSRVESWVHGLAVASAAIILHSALDFNLALASVGLILWGMLGVLRGLDSDVRSSRHSGSLIPPAVWLVCLVLSALFLLGHLSAQKGVSHYRADQPERAIAAFLQATKLDPLSAKYFVDLARVSEELAVSRNDPTLLQQAFRYMQKAIDLEPHLPSIHAEFALFALRYGGYDQGIEALRRAVEVHPMEVSRYRQLGEGLYLLGLHFLSQGETAEAHRYLTELESVAADLRQRSEVIPPLVPVEYRLPATDPSLDLYVGAGLVMLGRDNEALTYLERAQQDSEVTSSALTWKAVAYRRLGRDSEADGYLEAAIGKDSEAQSLYDEVLELLGVGQ